MHPIGRGRWTSSSTSPPTGGRSRSSRSSMSTPVSVWAGWSSAVSPVSTWSVNSVAWRLSLTPSRRCCGATRDLNWPAVQWPTGHRVRLVCTSFRPIAAGKRFARAPSPNTYGACDLLMITLPSTLTTVDLQHGYRSRGPVYGVRPRPLGAAARIRTLLPPGGRPGHHGVLDPVFHDVAAAAASKTGSKTGVARHRNTVEQSIRLRSDRACGADQLGLFHLRGRRPVPTGGHRQPPESAGLAHTGRHLARERHRCAANAAKCRRRNCRKRCAAYACGAACSGVEQLLAHAETEVS